MTKLILAEMKQPHTILYEIYELNTQTQNKIDLSKVQDGCACQISIEEYDSTARDVLTSLVTKVNIVCLNLESIKNIDELLNLFLQHKSLKTLSIKSDLNDDDVLHLMNFIKFHPSLSTLNCSGSKINTSDKYSSLITETFTEVKLEVINFSGVSFSSNCFNAMAHGLINNKNTLDLNLGSFSILDSDNSINSLIQLIKHNESIKDFNLMWTNFSEVDLISVLRAFRDNQTVQKLTLSFLKLQVTQEVIQSLADMIEHNKVIKELDVHATITTENEVSQLIPSLMNNYSLTGWYGGFANSIHEQIVSNVLVRNSLIQKMELIKNRIRFRREMRYFFALTTEKAAIPKEIWQNILNVLFDGNPLPQNDKLTILLLVCFFLSTPKEKRNWQETIEIKALDKYNDKKLIAICRQQYPSFFQNCNKISYQFEEGNIESLQASISEMNNQLQTFTEFKK